MVRETNAEDSAAVASGFRIAGNIERISDHAMNILAMASGWKRRISSCPTRHSRS